MDYNILSKSISTFGFPVVCVIGLAWFVLYLVKVSQADKERLYTELERCRIVNQSFLTTLQEIKQDLGRKVDSVQKEMEDIKDKLDR